MEDEEYDESLRWRLELLKVQLEQGKVHIAPHLADDFEKSLSAVKYAADGRIDLETVDARVRAMSLMAVVSHQRKEAKDAISLQEISELYFKYVGEKLGFFAEKAKEGGHNAHSFAAMVSSQPNAVAEISPQIPKFLEGLSHLWEAALDPSHFHIQDLSGTKAVFGGDLFPSYERNIASSVGLYVDTVVLTDPFSHSRTIFERSSPEQQVYYFLKHAISVLNYRDLVLAEVDEPIVVISPHKSSIDEQEQEFLWHASEADGLKHAGHLFDRDFESIEELTEYVSRMDTPEEVAKHIENSERLLFDSDWTGEITDQIRRALDSNEAELLDNPHAGEMIARQCMGRMMQATDVLLKSRYLMGVPLIDAPTSWQFFNWKLEYNSALDTDDSTNLHMVRGLQRAADTDMHWLGNIPPEALIEMRQQGAFHEIREMLSTGIEEIAVANPDAFFRSSDQIVENIHEAFAKHQENIDELRRKGLRFAGHDLGTWVVSGAIELAAIATGTPAFGAAAFGIHQVVDAPKLKEIPERFRNLKNAHVELKKSPMGLFFSHQER